MRMTLFRDLHADGLLILPNVWDAGSAAVMKAAGAKAIATTSAGCAWSLGWPDGDALPPERAIRMCEDVVRAVPDLPVSVDFEGGYSDDPAEVAALAARLVEAGAAGINIEDGGGDASVLAAKIAAIRARVGPDLFINARCDLWLRGVGEAGGRADEAARLAAIYGDAGSDGFFAPGVTDPETISALVGKVTQPLNLLAMPGLPDAANLEALGVRRLSAGSGISSAIYGRAKVLAEGFLADGRFEPMATEALGWGEMNVLMPKA
jgi:2-methylisocitrate lyase-like PEP mutase family enzyme